MDFTLGFRCLFDDPASMPTMRNTGIPVPSSQALAEPARLTYPERGRRWCKHCHGAGRPSPADHVGMGRCSA